ncbi:MAG: tetratricopeptide repeat protein [Chitinispirillaceae bacterium]
MKKLNWLIFPLLVIISLQVTAEDSEEYIHYRLAVKYKNEKKYDKSIDEFRKVLAAYPDHYNSYMHLAQIRSLQGKNQLVIDNLKKALSYNPGWSKAQKKLAEAYEADGQLQKAVQELQHYNSTSDPSERKNVQAKIDKLLQKINGGSAPEGAEQKTIVQPTFSVHSDSTTGKPSKGEPAKKVKVNPEVEKLYSDAVDLYKEKQYDEAINRIRELLKLQPGHPGAYYYAGHIRRKKGQTSMAEINFSKALNHPKLGNSAHYNLGRIYGEQGKNAEAAKHLKASLSGKAIDFDKQKAKALLEMYRKDAPSTKPRQAKKRNTGKATPLAPERNAPIEIRIDSMLSMMTVDTLTDLGQKLLGGIREFKAGRFDNAVREFKKLLADNPNGTIAAHCIYNTGVCYYKLRLFKEAEHQFQQFLNRFPAHPFAPKALFLKALCYQERGDYKVSEQLLRKFIREHRTHEWVGRAYEKLGDSYADLDQMKKAVDAYTQALAKKPSSADEVMIQFKLGNAYSSVGNDTRAIASFRNAIKTGEKNKLYVRVPDSYYKVADILYQQKKYKDALKNYKHVTRKYPAFQETPWGLFQIASIHRNLEEYRKAISNYKDLMKKYPEDYWAKQAKWKLEDTVWEHQYRSVTN